MTRLGYWSPTLTFYSQFAGEENCFAFSFFSRRCGFNTGTGAVAAFNIHCKTPGTYKVTLTAPGGTVFMDTFELIATGLKADVLLDPQASAGKRVGGGFT